MEWQILIALVGVMAVISIYYWGAKRLEKNPAKDSK